MIKSDLILRMIEQCTAAIAEVVGLRRGGKPEEAQARLDAAFSALVGIGRPLAERLTPQSLRDLALTGPSAADRAGVFAKLFDEQANLYQATGRADAAERCRKLRDWCSELAAGQS